jgi:hypothetical protein
MTASLAPDHTPVTLALTERDKALNSVFTTALEGGIGYWSVCSRYRWAVETAKDHLEEAADFIAVVHDIEDDDETAYVIDRTVIARGIRKAHARGGWADYHAAALGDLQFGRYDDADYDADTADLIVQFGLFGEQRYN